MEQNNKTAAVAILVSKQYNDTLETVTCDIERLQILVTDDSDNQSQIVYICSVTGMCITVLALLYNIPSTVYLMVIERRHTRTVRAEFVFCLPIVRSWCSILCLAC